jgi:hypothetical protein
VESLRRPRTSRKTKAQWQRPPNAQPLGISAELPVNLSLPPGCTHADVVQKIAEQLGWRVSLPEQLTRNPMPRGRTVFGSAREVLNQIVANHEDLHWTVEDGALRFEIRDARAEPPPSRIKPLSVREQKIWEVIQRGLTGKQYLRELHRAGLRPRQSWTDRGCPATYARIAEDDVDPKWRQAAQDEKSKIRRKAEALQLDF